MSDKNEATVVTALLTAAQVYDKDAKDIRDKLPALLAVYRPGYERIAEQFERQAQEARELADKIEASGLDQVAFL